MRLSGLALSFSIVFAPLVSAGLFPSGTKVKFLEGKDFKKEVLKPNRTSVVAFVAPWCGHCQRLAPEYVKAAESLDPLVPLYVVDCDAEQNKQLCSEQGVRGFPTVKLFPRGDKAPAIPFNEERTAKSLVEFTTRSVPHGVRKLDKIEKLYGLAIGDTSKPRALLLSVPKSKEQTDMPLLWKVLANQYKHAISFAASPDGRGMKAAKLGFESETPESKVLIYPVGSSEPVLYTGKMKFAHLSEYFSDILDGSIVFKASTPSSSVEAESAVESEVPAGGNEAPGASAGNIHASSVVQGEAPTATAIELNQEQEQVILAAEEDTVAHAGSAAALHESSAQVAQAAPTTPGAVEVEIEAETATVSEETPATDTSSSASMAAVPEAEPDTVVEAATPEVPAEPSTDTEASAERIPLPEPGQAGTGKRDEL